MTGQQTRLAHPTVGRRLRLPAAGLAAALLIMIAGTSSVRGATLTVTNTNDTGAGSLRAAIDAANGTSAADTITFNIPGTGVKTIAPSTALPDLTAPVTIDGYSQPGSSANTLAVGNNAVLVIELSGAGAPAGTDGLRLNTDDSVIQGLIINGWKSTVPAGPQGGRGVRVLLNADRNVVRGNFLGTNAAATAAIPNLEGLRIEGGADNMVGGTTPAARNVISGNTTGTVIYGVDGRRTPPAGSPMRNLVQGNYIGTNGDGSTAVPNRFGVLVFGQAEATVLGGTPSGARNIISGNTEIGVDLAGRGGELGQIDTTLVQGNWIGLSAAGTSAVPNGEGISLTRGATVGGGSPGAGNVISGNLGDGIVRVMSEPSTGGNGPAVVQGNLIGTTPAGDAAIGNGGDGVSTGNAGSVSDTTIEDNVISGNAGSGINQGLDGNSIVVNGNRIGTGTDGAMPLGNGGYGIMTAAGGLDFIGNPEPGDANVISYNALDGIAVVDFGSAVIIANSIHSNGGLGIDLGNDGVTPNDPGDADDGPNQLQNYPVLASAVLLSSGNTRIRVQLDVQPNDTYTVEFFSNAAADPTGFGEGQSYIGSADIAVGASGMANQLVTLPVALPVGTPVTSTIAYGINAITSEFSNAVDVVPSLRIDDVSAAEGDSGTTDYTFTAQLAAPAEEDVSFDYATTDDSATQPSDYASRSGTLTIPQGQTSRTITVPVNGDTDAEPDERFFLDLTAFSLGADAIEDGRGMGTITDDDTVGAELPVLSIDDVSGAEGDSGFTDFVFTVTRSGDLSRASSVHFHTEDGSAKTPQDFVAIRHGVLNFGIGAATKRITVRVRGDGERAPAESFFVVLNRPTEATLGDARGEGTIFADDPYLAIRNVTVNEPAAGYVVARFRVDLSYPTVNEVKVHYRTSNGTAHAGSDYMAVRDEVLRFAPGERTKWVRVRVLADGRTEPDERFFVTLFNATGGDGAMRIADATGRATIRD